MHWRKVFYFVTSIFYLCSIPAVAQQFLHTDQFGEEINYQGLQECTFGGYVSFGDSEFTYPEVAKVYTTKNYNVLYYHLLTGIERDDTGAIDKEQIQPFYKFVPDKVAGFVNERSTDPTDDIHVTKIIIRNPDISYSGDYIYDMVKYDISVVFNLEDNPLIATEMNTSTGQLVCEDEIDQTYIDYE